MFPGYAYDARLDRRRETTEWGERVGEGEAREVKETELCVEHKTRETNEMPGGGREGKSELQREKQTRLPNMICECICSFYAIRQW